MITSNLKKARYLLENESATIEAGLFDFFKSGVDRNLVEALWKNKVQISVITKPFIDTIMARAGDYNKVIKESIASIAEAKMIFLDDGLWISYSSIEELTNTLKGIKMTRNPYPLQVSGGSGNTYDLLGAMYKGNLFFWGTELFDKKSFVGVDIIATDEKAYKAIVEGLINAINSK